MGLLQLLLFDAGMAVEGKPITRNAVSSAMESSLQIPSLLLSLYEHLTHH